MKKLLLIAFGILALGGGAYGVSPYLAASNLKAAAISNNKDTIEASVDFPAVRDSLKSQLSAAATRKMNADPSMKDNPMAGLGMMLMPAIIDKFVDTYVTPDGLSAMVRGSKPQDSKGKGASENPDVEYDYEWVSSDRFRVNMTNKETRKEGPSLVFERRSLLSWKLIKIDVDDSFLDD